MRNRATARSAALIVLGAVVFLAMLGRRDIVISHEARVAQTARQMAASGWPWAATRIAVPIVTLRDTKDGKRLLPSGEGTAEINPWLVPVLNGQIRLQKPPLPYWCAATCFRLFGVGEWQARLVPALLGLCGALVVFDLARRVTSGRAAWFAALAWVSTHFVVDEYRKSMADPYVAFAVLVAAWGWIRATERTRRSTAWLILFYLAAAWGFLAKGPPVFLPWAAIVIAGYHLCLRRRLPTSVAGHAVGAVILVVLGCGWYAYAFEAVPHAVDLWRYESLGEIGGENQENVRQWWFYLPNFFLITVPWLLMMVMAIWRAIERRRRHSTWFAAVWLFAPIVLFSFLGQKKNAYLLPAMPAAAILAGQGIAVLLAVARRQRADIWPGVIAGIQAWVGTGFGVATVILLAEMKSPPWQIALAAVAVAVAAWSFIALLRSIDRWTVPQACAYALAIAAFINLYVTTKENARSARQFVSDARAYIDREGGALNRPKLPEEASFYLPLDYTGPGTSNHVYAIVDDRRDEVKADVREMGGMANGRRVIAAREVPVNSSRRWKLFELTVE